ncbi:MAG: HlyD family efflux transporter periplasmic adaptor subunit [Candidatus Magasanikbacteria bacterium]|nr:HlyD family efflux transporter periplasmic adaptor subunit [Candidatus Magasanikbacteria bacterium]
MKKEKITPNNTTTILKKIPWYKKKAPYIIIVTLFIFSGVAYGKYKDNNKPIEYETVFVEQGELVQTVDGTGNIESALEIDLHFETNGKVVRIDKQINEEIKIGEIIAVLDTRDINARIAGANANVARARADLETVLAGNTDAKISSMQAAVDKTKADLAQIKVTDEKAIQNAISAKETAQNNLKLSEGGDDSQIVEDAYGDLTALFYTIQNDMAQALTQADNILGIDNVLSNDEYEDVLGSLNSNTLTTAKSNYTIARTKKNNTDSSVNALGLIPTHTTIDQTTLTITEGLSAIRQLLFSVSDLLNSTAPIGDLSTTELAALKTNIETVRTSIAGDHTALINANQAVQTAKNSYTSYQISYDKAVLDLTNAEKKAAANLATYQALIDQAQANLNDTKNPPRDTEVAVYRASLSANQASLAQVVAEREKSILRAPATGVLGKIDMKIGEYMTSQNMAAKIINPDFQIKVDIPETDIVKIASGNKATVTFDAFGDDVELEAVTEIIEKGETVIQDVIYYTVTLSFPKTEGYTLLNGMTADVVFYTSKIEDALYIPQRIIRTNGIGKYVRVLKNGDVEERPVVLGLRGDSGLVEIKEGLEEGEELVVSIVE